MKVISVGILIFFSFILSLQTALAVEYPWQLRMNKEDISVYTRSVEGSPILEFRANVIVNEPLVKVVNFFEDDKKITEWYYQCVRAEVIEKKSLGEKIFYFVTNLAWPVADRDCVFSQVKSINTRDGAVSYAICALPENFPREKGKIRVLDLNATWRFTPLKDGRTEIYFQQHSNPGGSIPSLLVNRLSVEIPFNCLKNLRKMIGEIKD